MAMVIHMAMAIRCGDCPDDGEAVMAIKVVDLDARPMAIDDAIQVLCSRLMAQPLYPIQQLKDTATELL